MKQKCVVIKGSGGGGLGDRIRSVLVGCLYAECTGRAIFVDWRDGVYGPVGVNTFDELFQIHSLPVLDSIEDSGGDIQPPAWSGRLDMSLDTVWRQDGNVRWNRGETIERYSFDLGNPHHGHQVLVMWEFDQLNKLRPFLPVDIRSLDEEALLSTAWNRYLAPHNNISEEADQCFKGAQGPFLGVHVRSTIESQSQKGLVPLRHYHATLDRLIKENIPGRIGRILVATDNADMENRLLKKYPQAWSRKKWFARPGESLHLNEDCPDKLQAARDAIVEMHMLARCDTLVSVENSSFSLVARIMADKNRTRHVILKPKPTFSQKILYRLKRLFKNG